MFYHNCSLFDLNLSQLTFIIYDLKTYKITVVRDEYARKHAKIWFEIKKRQNEMRNEIKKIIFVIT